MEQALTIDWFRHTAPYIKRHQGRTFVIVLGSGALESTNFTNLIHDIVLLHTLGVRLIIVHGTRQSIEEHLALKGLASHFHREIRITDHPTLDIVSEVTAQQRIRIESKLSMGLPNSPMQGARLRVVSGNFVTARPLGVVDGVDFQFTGAIRRVDAMGIMASLDNQAIVLLSPLGYSPTGELFNLSSDELATAAALSTGADKILFLHEYDGLYGEDKRLIRQCTVSRARQLAPRDPAQGILLDAACRACEQGIPRVHLLNHSKNGGLIEELFTHKGTGTLISEFDFEQARRATPDDIGGVLELVEPLEASGVLVRRSRELFEQEIDRFRVLERDGRIIACAALYPFPESASAELACIVTHPDYRGGQRGERLLSMLEDEAQALGLSHLFVLTTQTAHWFREQGFVEVDKSHLPPAKQALYNLQRNSKVLSKRISG
jgi:amino-acid N-acetyltransferase